MSTPRIYVHISPAAASYVHRSAPIVNAPVATPPSPVRDTFTVRPTYTGDGFIFTPQRQRAEDGPNTSTAIKEFFSWLFGG